MADFEFSGQTNVYHGKVRDVYFIDDGLLVMIASNRISAFDVVLPKEIPYKGQVLNQLADYFLKATADVADSWLISSPHPNVSIGHECEPYTIEVIVRSCLVGHSWRTYESGKRELCGVKLAEGMDEYDRFDPIITPTTKAYEGHDEDISYDEIIEQGIVSKEELDEMYETAHRLFKRGQEMAEKQGLLLADTKYEFGKKDGKILLIDEVHTPDSSRYFYMESYEAHIKDRSQPKPAHLSKEFVREWLMENGFRGNEGEEIPEMTPKFVKSVSDRYVKLFEEITGSEFRPEPTDNLNDDIQDAVEASLENGKLK